MGCYEKEYYGEERVLEVYIDGLVIECFFKEVIFEVRFVGGG